MGGEGGVGGLECEAKAQVFVVTPSPLFFLEVGHKKGGVTVGQYGTYIRARVAMYNMCQMAELPAVPFIFDEEIEKELELDLLESEESCLAGNMLLIL